MLAEGVGGKGRTEPSDGVLSSAARAGAGTSAAAPIEAAPINAARANPTRKSRFIASCPRPIETAFFRFGRKKPG